MNESLPDVSAEEKQADKYRATIRKLKKITEDEKESDDNRLIAQTEMVLTTTKLESLNEVIANGHNYVFIGKVGLFAPVKSGVGGGLLMREKDGKMYAASGTTGYRWIEAETVHDHLEDVVDMSYFIALDDAAIDAINEYGDFYDFIDISGCSTAGLPWDHKPMCGESSYENCLDCPHWRIQLDKENYEEMFACDKQ